MRQSAIAIACALIVSMTTVGRGDDGPSSDTVAPREGRTAARSTPPSGSARNPGTTVETPNGHASPAHAALAAGNPRRALDLLQSRTCTLSPADRHSVAGRACFELGQFTEARRELLSAVRMRPNRAIDHYWLGRAYAASGSPALATNRFEQAHWSGLETAELHYHWALALQTIGSPLGRVQRRLCPAGALPKPGDLAMGGIVVSVDTNVPMHVVLCERNSALGHALRCVQLDPKCGDCWKLAGDIWFAAKEPGTASVMYEGAVGALAGKAKGDCLLQWARCALALGKLDDYLSRMRDGLILQGKEMDSARLAEAYDTAASEVSIRGDLARQIRYLKLAVELRPTAQRETALAEVLLQAHQPGDALAHLQAARELAPPAELRRRIDLAVARASFFTAAP